MNRDGLRPLTVELDAEEFAEVEAARDRIEEETGLDLTVEEVLTFLVTHAAGTDPDPEELVDALDLANGGEADE